jgi:hypothetical protein
MRAALRYFILWSFATCPAWSIACECPLTALGIEECNKYEIIFKGRVTSVQDCNNKFGEAIFEIDELYKGNATRHFKVLFECDVECAMKFSAGQEWIIYSRYKQIDNALIDWCSRSRKYFRNEKEDFYAVTYGNDYHDEVKFLRTNLGLHRPLSERSHQDQNRNTLPDTSQTAIILVISLTVIILFYWLFKKFFN